MAFTPLRALSRPDDAARAVRAWLEVAEVRGFSDPADPAQQERWNTVEAFARATSLSERMSAWRKVHSWYSELNPRAFDYFDFTPSATDSMTVSREWKDFLEAFDTSGKYF